MHTRASRAVERGELAAMPRPRIVSLPIDLLRHELFMTLDGATSHTIVEIVDDVFLPLAINFGSWHGVDQQARGTQDFLKSGPPCCMAAEGFGHGKRHVPLQELLRRNRFRRQELGRPVMLFISKFRLIVAGVLTASAFSVLGAGTAYAIQTHMVNARDDLQQSLTQLQQAEPDKGGHRDQAINLVEQAISQVNQGIQYAN